MLKKADINLSGLSPETVNQNSQPPPPMETPGYSKAKAIMEMASQAKTASQKHPAPVTLPQIEKLLEKHKEEEKDSNLERHKRLGGYVLAGSGAGNLLASRVVNPIRHLTNFHPPTGRVSKLELGATLLGAAGGAVQARRAKKHHKHKTSAATPGIQFRTEESVGRHNVETGASVGKTPQQQIRGRLMGKKFIRHEKIAGITPGSEELDRVRSTVLTREDTRAAADAMFGEQAIEARKKEREMVAKLFLQAPAAQTMAPVLQKEASIEELAPNTVAFFEKVAQFSGMTEAQMRYPELLKVASGRSADTPRPAAVVSKKTSMPTSGPTPTQSQGSGGSA